MRAANETVTPAVTTRLDLLELLRRCRHALAVGAPEWERDVETAMEKDAALVADIDAVLSTT